MASLLRCGAVRCPAAAQVGVYLSAEAAVLVLIGRQAQIVRFTTATAPEVEAVLVLIQHALEDELEGVSRQWLPGSPDVFAPSVPPPAQRAPPGLGTTG